MDGDLWTSLLGCLVLLYGTALYLLWTYASIKKGEPAWTRSQRVQITVVSVLLIGMGFMSYMPDDFTPAWLGVSLWQYGPARRLTGLSVMISCSVCLLSVLVDALMSAKRK